MNRFLSTASSWCSRWVCKRIWNCYVICGKWKSIPLHKIRSEMFLQILLPHVFPNSFSKRNVVLMQVIRENFFILLSSISLFISFQKLCVFYYMKRGISSRMLVVWRCQQFSVRFRLNTRQKHQAYTSKNTIKIFYVSVVALEKRI